MALAALAVPSRAFARGFAADKMEDLGDLSESEADDGMTVVGDEPTGGRGDREEDVDAGSISDSPELVCCGCGSSSKKPDIVSVKKKIKNPPTTTWGKTTCRRLRSKSGRIVKLKRRCGGWCRLCFNNSRRWMKEKKYLPLLKKSGKKACTKKLKEDLRQDKEFRKRWKGEIEESAHLLAGGRSRIRASRVQVDVVDEVVHELIDDTLVFYSLAKYKTDIGDPKLTKAKIVTRQKGRNIVKGIYVRVKEDTGIYPVRATYRNRVSRTKPKNFGPTLHEAEPDEAMDEALGDLDEDAEMTQGVLTMEESLRRARVAGGGGGGQPNEADGEQDGSDSEASSKGDSDSDTDDSDKSSGGGWSDSGSSGSEKKKKKKKRAAGAAGVGATGAAASAAKRPNSPTPSSGATGTTKRPKKRDEGPPANVGYFQAFTQALQGFMEEYMAGKKDQLRGRPLSITLREWSEQITGVRKLAKASRETPERREAVTLADQLDCVTSLTKVCSKVQPTYLEVAGAWDTLRTAGGAASAGHSSCLVLRHMDHLLANNDFTKAASVLGGTPGQHNISCVVDQKEKDTTMSQLIVKYISVALLAKISGPVSEAEAAARTTMDLVLKHADRPSWSKGLAYQLDTIEGLMNPESRKNDELGTMLGEIKKYQDVADGRKVQTAPLAAFVLSKLAKHWVKIASQLLESNAKDRLVVGELDKIFQVAKDLPHTVKDDMVKQVSQVVRRLQLQVGVLPIGKSVPDIVGNVVETLESWVGKASHSLAKKWHENLTEDGDSFKIMDKEDSPDPLSLLVEFDKFWQAFKLNEAPKALRKQALEKMPPGVLNFGPILHFVTILKKTRAEEATITGDEGP